MFTKKAIFQVSKPPALTSPRFPDAFRPQQKTMAGSTTLCPDRAGCEHSNALGRWDDYLEDHPMTCKWLITMVIVSPLTGATFPLQMAIHGL